MIGRISGDSRVVDAMSNQDGIIVNKGEVEPMGRQIYETFQQCELTGVIIVQPNAANYYNLEMWEDLSRAGCSGGCCIGHHHPF